MTAPTTPISASSSDDSIEQLVSVRTAVKALDVGERTLRRWLADGTLPSVKLPGGIVRIRVSDIEKLPQTDA